MRQAGTWDPLLQCLHLDNHLLQQQMQRNSKGLKITARMRSGGKLRRTRYKKAKTQLPLPRYGSKSRVLCMTPAHGTTKGVARPSKPPLRPDPPTYPHPHPVYQPAPPPGSSKGTSYLFSLPRAVAGTSIKPCLNSSPGLINFY